MAQPDGSPQQAVAPDEARSDRPAGRDQERQSVGQQPSRASTAQPGGSATSQREPQSVQPEQPQREEPEPAEPARSSGQPGLPGDEAGGAAPEVQATDPEAAESAEEATEAGEDGSTAETQAGSDTGATRNGSHPSARSGAGDLWSGFDAGDNTLSPGLDQPAAGTQDGGMSQQLALAVGLFGAGALALMGGGFAAAFRRRRAVATAGTHRDV